MNIEELKEFIGDADACGHVPLVRGLHGIGKSESSAQYAKDENLHFEPLILSLMDTGDMLGIPVENNVGGLTSTTWAAPTWYSNIVNAAWPNVLKYERLEFSDTGFQSFVHDQMSSDTYVSREQLNSWYTQYYDLIPGTLHLLRQDNVHYLDSRRSLLLLDEFNRAHQDILDASLQLILDHRLHSHILPRVQGKETLIIAAINPADGNYAVKEFDPALLDRFVECEILPDFQSWLKYAKRTGVNIAIQDFLTDNQKKFHFVPEDGTKGASPRSWTRLAKYISYVEAKKGTISTEYIKGSVGSALAAQFISFYNNYDSSLSFKELDKQIRTAMKKFCTAKTKELGTKSSANDYVPEIAQTLEELVEGLDVIKRNDYAESFAEAYAHHENVEKALPWMIYLHALPLENLSAVLKSLQSDNVEVFAQLVTFDKETTNKALLRKITSALKRTAI